MIKYFATTPNTETIVPELELPWLSYFYKIVLTKDRGYIAIRRKTGRCECEPGYICDIHRNKTNE